MINDKIEELKDMQSDMNYDLDEMLSLVQEARGEAEGQMKDYLDDMEGLLKDFQRSYLN